MAQNMKRGRNSRRRQTANVNRAMDSTGPEVKIRGTALQIYDKYQTLARDAASAGDRVRAESLLQHAEHYFRVMKAMQPQQLPQNDPSDENQPSYEGDGNGNRNRKRAQDDDDSDSDGDDATAEANEESADDENDGDDNEVVEEKPKRQRRRRSPRKSADAGKDGAGGDGDSDDSRGKVPEVAAE